MPTLRRLFASPGFATVSVLTLALGIGGNTAIFSAVYAVLLRPLPFPDGDRIVSVRSMVKRDGWERRSFSTPDFLDYRARATKSFAAFAALDGANFNLTGEGEAAFVRAERVSPDYFSVLGTAPALGRTFSTAEDSAPNLAPLVVLSHDFWQQRFAGSREVLGRQIKLTDVDYTIVGVMPAGFRGLNDAAQLWVPMTTIGASTWNNRGARWHEVVARLRPGVTLEQARTELATIGLDLAAQFPATNVNYSVDLAPLRDELFGALRGPLFVMLGAVGLVLLITCVNVANLLLVRLATRRREIAIRVSVGASRAALARLFLGEALLLSVAGGTLGVLLALWGVAALKRFAPLDLPAFVHVELHWPAVAFAAAATLLCALAIGALPALFAARGELGTALKDAGRTSHASGVVGTRARAILVATELALSLALLIGASLFVRSFINLVSQTPGYRTERIVFQRLLLPHLRYDGEARQQFARTLLERAATLPGVQAAALATDTPLDGNVSASFVTIEGGSPVATENEARTHTHSVTRDFFAATGMRLVQGEPFAPAYPRGSEPVVIVSENFARRFWPDGTAIGKRFKLGKSAVQSPWMRIIGVVGDAKYRSLVADATRDPDIYLPLDQRPTTSFSIVIQSVADSGTIGANLQRLVAALDPNVPVFGRTTIEQRVSRAASSQRFSAQLMGIFAVLALLLAAVGLFGVVSFSVTQRTSEIGVRMALGADTRAILQLIIGETGRLIGAGLAAGLVVAWIGARLVQSLLFGVHPHDPLTYFAVVTTLAIVALLAAWLPARRAARVDPVVALRSE